jgi:hypothetical protein
MEAEEILGRPGRILARGLKPLVRLDRRAQCKGTGYPCSKPALQAAPVQRSLQSRALRYVVVKAAEGLARSRGPNVQLRYLPFVPRFWRSHWFLRQMLYLGWRNIWQKLFRA